jgi:hypothetical protein
MNIAINSDGDVVYVFCKYRVRRCRRLRQRLSVRPSFHRLGHRYRRPLLSYRQPLVCHGVSAKMFDDDDERGAWLLFEPRQPTVLRRLALLRRQTLTTSRQSLSSASSSAMQYEYSFNSPFESRFGLIGASCVPVGRAKPLRFLPQ